MFDYDDVIKASEKGGYLNTNGIRYDLDGKGMADYLRSIGFEVIQHYDTGRNGIVILKDGIKVSTNGYCHMS